MIKGKSEIDSEQDSILDVKENLYDGRLGIVHCFRRV